MPQSKSKIKSQLVDLTKQTKTTIKPIKRTTHIHFSDYP